MKTTPLISKQKVGAKGKAKFAQVEYSPETYAALKSYVSEKNLRKHLSQYIKDDKLIYVIEAEWLKMMSLSPKSLATKMKQCCQCLVDTGSVMQKEAKVLNQLFNAYAKDDEAAGQKILGKITTADSKNSKTFQVIADELKKAGFKDDNSGSNVQARGWFKDFLTGVGIAVGGAIGALVGGPLGAIIGAAAGGFIGRGLGGLIGTGTGFMPGPNGESCTPPFLNF